MTNNKTVEDVMICPQCGSDNCYSYNKDEIEFSYDNTGHYHADCRCNECKKNFRLYTKFEYNITESYTR